MKVQMQHSLPKLSNISKVLLQVSFIFYVFFFTVPIFKVIPLFYMLIRLKYSFKSEFGDS